MVDHQQADFQSAPAGFQPRTPTTINTTTGRQTFSLYLRAFSPGLSVQHTTGGRGQTLASYYVWSGKPHTSLRPLRPQAPYLTSTGLAVTLGQRARLASHTWPGDGYLLPSCCRRVRSLAAPPSIVRPFRPQREGVAYALRFGGIGGPLPPARPQH